LLRSPKSPPLPGWNPNGKSVMARPTRGENG
jgi:hypothetical protein